MDEIRRVWMKAESDGLEIILPYTPFFKVNHSIEVESESTMSGEVDLGYKVNLDTIDMEESHFPYFKSTPYRVDRVKYEPWYYKKVLEDWLKRGEIVHFTYYSDYKTINDYERMRITSFVPYEKNGNRNIYYTMSLKEYKKQEISSATMDIDSARIIKEYGSPYYFVGEGDTLQNIAEKLYGDSDKWDYLMNNNNLKNPLDLTIGQKLKI